MRKNILILAIILLAAWWVLHYFRLGEVDPEPAWQAQPTNGVFDKERLGGSAAVEYYEGEKPKKVELPPPPPTPAIEPGRALPQSYRPAH